MKRSKAWILVLVCLALVLGPTAVFARRRLARRAPPAVPATVTWPAPAPAPATVARLPSQAFKIDPKQAMADILRIRQTEGTINDEASEAAFEEALREIITKEHGEVPVPAVKAEVSKPTASPVDALRQSAKHFDDRAAAFEAAKDYAAADSARETAAELRREARRLDP